MHNIFRIKGLLRLPDRKERQHHRQILFQGGHCDEILPVTQKKWRDHPEEQYRPDRKRYPGSGSQSQAFHSCFLCRDTAHKTLHIEVKPFFVIRVGSNSKLFHTGKNMIPQIIL